MNTVRRRPFTIGLAATVGLAVSGVRLVRAEPAWAAWKDLLNFAPDRASLSAARSARGRPPLVFEVQRIAEAEKPVVNLDEFAVRIQTLPKVDGSLLTDIQLLSYVRKNLSLFMDGQVAQMGPHLPEDQTEWNQQAMLGTIMLFHIYKIGLPLERGAVVVSKVSPRSWIFSPVKIGAGIIGTHPVAGNREFGIKPDGVEHLLYVRAADRPYDKLPSEVIVFEGADALWTSFQSRLTKFVNDNGGKATIVTPVKYRPQWQTIIDEGYYSK
jgi:hypothetical protein